MIMIIKIKKHRIIPIALKACQLTMTPASKAPRKPETHVPQPTVSKSSHYALMIVPPIPETKKSIAIFI